jgi:hypothetical protein
MRSWRGFFSASKSSDLASKGDTEMSTEANKAVVRRWAEEVLSKGNLTTIDELFAADYVGVTIFFWARPTLRPFNSLSSCFSCKTREKRLVLMASQ